MYSLWNESLSPATVSDADDYAAVTTSSSAHAAAVAANRTAYRLEKLCMLATTFGINSVGAGIICLLGFVGNSLSFVILSRDRNTSPVAGFLLKSLAAADNLFLSVWFLHFSIADLFAYLGIERYFHVAWLYVRVYTYPLVFVGQTATIWLTVFIAGSRYIAVCMPYRAAVYCNMAITRYGVAAVAAFSVLYNVPRFFESQVAESRRNVNVTRHIPVRTWLGHSLLYKVWHYLVVN